MKTHQRVPLFQFFFGIVRLFFEFFSPRGTLSIFLMFCDRNVEKFEKVPVTAAQIKDKAVRENNLL